MTAAMTWELDREHEEFRASVRAFVDRHVRPVVTEAEQAGRPPAALLKEMGAAGLLGLPSARSTGARRRRPGHHRAGRGAGQGQRRHGHHPAGEQLHGRAPPGPLRHRRPGEAYLPGVAAGEIVAADRRHRAGTGSDVAASHPGHRERARAATARGTKMFITNAGHRRRAVSWPPRPSRDAGHRGITTFIVERRQARLWRSARPAEDGLAASDTREVILDDCFVRRGPVLGELNRGFYQIMSAFQLERLLLGRHGRGARRGMPAAGAAATPSTARRSARRSAACRRPAPAGRPWRSTSRRPGMLTYRAAARLDARPSRNGRGGGGHGQAGAAATRPTASPTRRSRSSAARASWTRRLSPAHYRDARVLRIGGGTDEIQLEILAKDRPVTRHG